MARIGTRFVTEGAWRTSPSLLPVIGRVTKHPGSKRGYHPRPRRPQPKRELVPAEPMDTGVRVSHYIAARPRADRFTPAQARRIRHKLRRLIPAKGGA